MVVLLGSLPSLGRGVMCEKMPKIMEKAETSRTPLVRQQLQHSQQHPSKHNMWRGCYRRLDFCLLSMIGSDLSQSVRCDFLSAHDTFITDAFYAFGSCQVLGLTNVKVLSHRIPYRRTSTTLMSTTKRRIAEYSQPHITLRQQVLDPFPLLSL